MAYPFNGKIVGVDIGHGKNTFPPSKGVYKDGQAYHEHDFNSKLAIALDELLQYNGFKTVMAQKPFANEVGLTQRTNFYDSQDVDLVWSIHANAGNKAADGRCAFYWNTNSKTKKLAEMFAEEVKNAGYTTHGNGTHAGVLGTWTNLHMIRVPKADAVLVENGFMTNDLTGIDDDFELVFGSKQDEYIYDMSRVHAKAICRHFGVKFHDFEGEPKTEPEPNTKTKPEQVKSQKFYRVRTTWEDAKSQSGAFLNLSGAKEVASKYQQNVYDWNGKEVYSGKPVASSNPKSGVVWVGTNDKGKRIEAIVSTVNFYDTQRWTNPTGKFKKGEGWTVNNLYRVNGSLQYQVKNSKGDLYYITARKDLVKVINAAKSKPKPKPKKVSTVTLPASATSWRTYKLNVQPVKKNSDWSLTPSRYGGLTYEILGRPYTDVVTINTGRGKRNIYVGKGTGAIIK